MTDIPGDSSADWPPPPSPPSSVEGALGPPSDIGWTEGGPAVSFSYQLQKEEVVGALRWEALRTHRLRVLLGSGALVLLCGALVMARNSNDSTGWFLVGAGVYVLALCGFVIARAPHRSWRRSASLRGPQSFTLSDSGIETHTTITESRAKWDFYSVTYETQDAYLLGIASRRAYYIFPKRVFRSLEDEQIFRDLVTRHTKANLRSAVPI